MQESREKAETAPVSPHSLGFRVSTPKGGGASSFVLLRRIWMAHDATTENQRGRGGEGGLER